MKWFILSTLVLLAVPVHAHQGLGDGVRELATQISATATKQAKQKIAILPFHELEGQPTVLGTYIAEELVTNLVQLGDFHVVERQLLHKVLGELKIEQTGAIDPATAKQVGKLTGVDAIVTGSITDLSTFVAVNCRLIDTSTGQVFGAAKATLTKDSDLTKLMGTALTNEDATADVPTYTAAHAVATKDIGMLRFALKSVLPSQRAVRWTFELTNRDARQPLLVAINAETKDPAPQYGLRIVTADTPLPSTPLRASVVDQRGGSWKLASADVNIGFVKGGVHGRHGDESYSPMEIVKLMTLRDQLGRNYDDPSDGIWAKATGMGEGGMNVTYGAGGNTSPEQFFRFRGNTFISGVPTTIAPGQSVTATMIFRPGEASDTSSGVFQFQCELVVGTTRHGYILDTVTFDRVSISEEHKQ
jgi:TolB-like protein